jgi:hypothetical protein
LFDKISAAPEAAFFLSDTAFASRLIFIIFCIFAATTGADGLLLLIFFTSFRATIKAPSPLNPYFVIGS